MEYETHLGLGSLYVLCSRCAVQRKNYLLQLHRRLADRRPGEPNILAHTDPLVVPEQGMSWPKSAGECWGKEGGMFDSREHMEVGKGGEGEGAHDRFDGITRGMLCDGVDNGSHCSRRRHGRPPEFRG